MTKSTRKRMEALHADFARWLQQAHTALAALRLGQRGVVLGHYVRRTDDGYVIELLGHQSEALDVEVCARRCVGAWHLVMRPSLSHKLIFMTTKAA